MDSSAQLSEQFLIAMPSLQDRHFARTVTYLWQHNEEGAIGLVINRLMDIKLGEIFRQMNIAVRSAEAAQMPVFQGGPVRPERGFVLHEPAGGWESTRRISDQLGITTSRDILEAIARGEGPRRSLVALGYAGWDAGQLESEIVANAWLCGPADTTILFETAVEDRHRAAAKKIGVDLDRLSADAGHA